MPLKLVPPKVVDFPSRVQVVCNGLLIAEVICPWSMAYRIHAKLAVLRYKRGLPAGGAIIQRADMPRYWNVPVGSKLVSPLKEKN